MMRFICLDEMHALRPLHLKAGDEGEAPERYPSVEADQRR
jgi:hypothetical protein